MTKKKHISPKALDASSVPKQRKPVPHAFVLDAISTLSPYTRPMFGCLAIYVKDKIVLILRDKPKNTADNGVWLAIPLHLPIKIHSEDSAADASGMTGNLSAAGVYIKADAALQVGSPVEFEITLPPEVTGGKEDVTIQCRGRVVRTDDRTDQRAGEQGAGAAPGEQRGVACVIDSYEFVRNS